ncbi:hypothetical protein JCM10213_002699 [Rhodosporidiobolus nylandii]
MFPESKLTHHPTTSNGKCFCEQAHMVPMSCEASEEEGPAKTGKQRQRRAATGGGEFMLPNNDFCDRCGGKGHFLCCEDGCLRSFHFQCLEPPLKIDKVPNESWYCKACQAAAVSQAPRFSDYGVVLSGEAVETQPEQPKGLSTNELAATSYAQQLQAQQTGFAGANGQSALQPQATGFA